MSSARPTDSSWPASGLERIDACPVCGDTRRSTAYRDLRDDVFFCAAGRWEFHRCGNCGSLYLDPRPTTDTIAAAYARYFTHSAATRPAVSSMGRMRRWQRALANGYRNWRYGMHEAPASPLGIPLAWMLPRQRALIDAELRHLPAPSPGARLLDIGCGDGAFLERAKRAGWQVLGIDFDPAAVAVAQSRGLDVRCGDVTAVPPESGPFDAITMSHVIEHVHNPAALLDSVRALLAPSGCVWIDTPNLDSEGHRRFGRAWFGLDPPRHLVLFTPDSLRRLLEDRGFRVVRTISRLEVADSVFVASDRIARGVDPFAHEPVSVPLRIRARIAMWRASFQSGRSEFITVVAVPDPNRRPDGSGR